MITWVVIINDNWVKVDNFATLLESDFKGNSIPHLSFGLLDLSYWDNLAKFIIRVLVVEGTYNVICYAA
jgi:hypothetical protein